MEDLSRKISELLSDPATMEKIKGLSGLLGQSEFSAPSSDEEKPSPPPAQNDFLNPEMLGMVMKFAPLLQSVNKDDESTCLLRALKPFLRDERRKKADEAIKLLGLMKMLPLLKGVGFDLFK